MLCDSDHTPQQVHKQMNFFGYQVIERVENAVNGLKISKKNTQNY